jgi:D-arabinose 1-dehydrogenase-like Zn-dependent alcohol dehydrogenase
MGMYISMMVVMMAQVTAVDIKEEKETEAVTLGAAQ